MPEVAIRTRLERAQVTVLCANGEEHKFSLVVDGSIADYAHNADEDAVISALGGELHACAKALKAFKAANLLFDAHTGTKDVPGIRKKRFSGQFTDGHTCSECANRNGSSIHHLMGAPHQASRLGVPLDATLAFTRWIARNREVSLPHLMGRRIQGALTPELSQSLSDERWPSLQRFATLNKLGITAPFARAAIKLVGTDVDQMIGLRSFAVRTEWVQDLASRLPLRVIEKARANNFTWVRNLGLSRNVPPAFIADFMQAGIYAHFHTYHKARATVGQVLQVYRNTNGQKTLAHYLQEGISIPDALRSSESFADDRTLSA